MNKLINLLEFGPEYHILSKTDKMISYRIYRAKHCSQREKGGHSHPHLNKTVVFEIDHNEDHCIRMRITTMLGFMTQEP